MDFSEGEINRLRLLRKTWSELHREAEQNFFVLEDVQLEEEYRKAWSIAEIFPTHGTGFTTHRDHFVIDFDEAVLRKRIALFRGTALSDEQVREQFRLANWDFVEARARVQQDENWKERITSCAYRPFDVRPIFYSEDVLDSPRSEIMKHLQTVNIAMVIGKAAHLAQDAEWDLLTVVDRICDTNIFYRGGGSVFPLYVYNVPKEDELALGAERQPNLSPRFVKTLCGQWGVPFRSAVEYLSSDVITPEGIFYYAYAVFHSSTYRQRYAEFLKIDLPRLPLTSDLELFHKLADKGKRLVALHLMKAPVLNRLITRFPERGSNIVEHVHYDFRQGRVYINPLQYFEGIPSEFWEFRVGRYAVLQKWLKDRKARALSLKDLYHYQKIVRALKETVRLMGEVDALIPGWPME